VSIPSTIHVPNLVIGMAECVCTFFISPTLRLSRRDQSMIETTRLGEKICTSILLNGEGRKQIVKPDYTERN